MRQLMNTAVTRWALAVFAASSLILLVNPAVAQDRFPPDSSVQSMLENIVLDPQATGMVVGLLEPDGSRRVIAYGSADSAGRRLDGKSVFEIGSITKVFTGALLADMVRRGEVKLTEPVARLLPPNVRVPSRSGKEITLLDLATHTSGLPVMPDNFPAPENAEAYAQYTAQQMYDFLTGYELPRDPGEEVEYSNFLSLLGHALALRAGKPYELLLRERILEPLGMEQTAIFSTPEMERHLTRGHGRFGDPAPQFVAPAFVASGGLKSTANDMLDFAAANLSEDSTGEYASLRHARRPQRRIGGTSDFFGLGWGTDSLGLEVGHTGGTFGYNSYIYIDSKSRRALVILANTSGRTTNELGVHLLDPNTFPRPKPSVGRAVATVYRRAGVEEAIERYRALSDTASTHWSFDVSELNAVGYWLLGRNEVDDAVAIFRLNVEMYPETPNVYDSLGDAYSAAGSLEEAIESYRCAVELADAVGNPNLPYYRENLEEANQQLSQQR